MTIQPWVKSYPPDVRSNAPLDLSSVQSVLDKAAERFGSKPALEFMGKRTTYAELGALANRAATGFQRLGVGPGVHVGLFLPNTPHYVIAFFGVLKAGGTVVNYSPLDALHDAPKKDRGQRDRHPGDARSGRALSSGRQAARFDPPQDARHRRVRRDGACARSRQGAYGGCGNAGRDQARRSSPGFPGLARQRRALSGPSARRPFECFGRHPIYRRHDRHAQGRDADARQSDGRLLALHGGHDPQRPRLAARRRGALSLHLAAVPHLFADGRHAPRISVGGRARLACPLRPRRRGQGHRRQEDHCLPGRADDACRDSERARRRIHGLVVPSTVRFGRSAASGRGAGAIRASDRPPID